MANEKIVIQQMLHGSNLQVMDVMKDVNATYLYIVYVFRACLLLN